MLVPYGKAQEAASGIDTLGGESNARVDHTRYNPSIPIGGVIPSQYWWMAVKAYERLAIKFDMIVGKDAKEDVIGNVMKKLDLYTELRFKKNNPSLFEPLSPAEELQLAQLTFKLKGIDYDRIENYHVLKDVVEGEIRWVANSTPRMAEIMQVVIKGSYEGATTLTVQPKQLQGAEKPEGEDMGMPRELTMEVPEQ